MTRLLAIGSNGEDVKYLQRLLNKHGAKLVIDGDYGRRTQRAVESFDQSHGLSEDGRVDASTWAALTRPPLPVPPTGMEPATLISSGSRAIKGAWNKYGGLLQTLSAQLGIHPAAAVAVLVTESRGVGFVDGKMKIRFENHVFKRRLKDDVLFNKHFTYRKSKPWKDHQWCRFPGSGNLWISFHGHQSMEWQVLEFAMTLDKEAALLSISMGLPQAMGFNYKSVGCSSVVEMFEEWQKGERQQIVGMFRFIQSNHRRVRALKNEDWVTFATLYNGPGQADHYGEVIGSRVEKAKAAGVK
jgi:hypothetical protein